MKIIQSSNNIINLYNDENIFDWYSKFSNNRIIRDRFGLDLNKYSPWHISDKVDILPDGNVSISIETALHEEISSICKLKKNVYIMWSGGVDSTAIICSFIQNGYSKTNIHILYTEDSIKEYPQFFNYLQKNSFNMILFDYSSLFELIKNVIQSDDILINGVHGDKLYEGLFPESYENIHWKQFVLENSGKQYIPIFEHILKSFNFNPTTTADFFWMMDFNFRWGETLTLPFVKNVILPFSSDTFQNICVNRMKTFHSYGVKESSNPSLYKPELKKLFLM